MPERATGAATPDARPDPGRSAAQLAAWRELWRLLLSPPEATAAACGEVAGGETGGADPDADSIVQRHYVFKIDGTVVADAELQLPDSHQEATVSWQSEAYADGPHLFEVTVSDEAGATASAVAAYGALNHPSGTGSADGSTHARRRAAPAKIRNAPHAAHESA